MVTIGVSAALVDHGKCQFPKSVSWEGASFLKGGHLWKMLWRRWQNRKPDIFWYLETEYTFNRVQEGVSKRCSNEIHHYLDKRSRAARKSTPICKEIRLTGIPKSGIHCILKHVHWKNFNPVLVHALIIESGVYFIQFVPGKWLDANVWSDEATLEWNGSIVP